MTTAPAAERRTRQRSEARRAILDATEALLVEGGVAHLSMRRLAERCGYTAPTIYHYFGDKPGLIDAVVEERFHRLLQRLRRVPRVEDPAEYLRALCRAFVRFGLQHPSHYQLLMLPRPDASEPPDSAERARDLLNVPLDALQQLGRLRSPDLESAAQTIWVVSHGLISLQILRPEYEWVPELPDRVVEVLLAGLVEPTAGAARAAAGDAR